MKEALKILTGDEARKLFADAILSLLWRAISGLAEARPGAAQESGPISVDF